MEGNGKGTEEDIKESILDVNDVEEVNEVQQRVRERFEKFQDEKNNIELSIEALYDRIFDGKQYSPAELKNSEDIVKKRIESIIGEYSEKDFYVFDFEKANKNVLNAEVIKTGTLEKLTYRILSMDQKTQDKFLSFLERRYISIDRTSLARKVIENEELLISKEAEKYHNLESKVEQDKDYLSDERKMILNKLWDCKVLVERSVGELDEYKKKIVRKQEEIDAAYEMEKDPNFISDLNKEKRELVDEARESKRMMVKTANYMERLNNLVDDISGREESMTAFYESLMSKRMNIELIYDFLEIAGKQMDISLEIGSYDSENLYTKETLERGIRLIKSVDKFNKETDKDFKKSLKNADSSIDAYLTEKKTNFDITPYLGEVDDIRNRVNEIVSYREQKEHERIKRVI